MNMRSRMKYPVLTAIAAMLGMVIWTAGAVSGQVLLNPKTQPKFAYPLPTPAKLTGTYHEIEMTEFQQPLGLVDPVTLAPLMTTVWGYHGTYPGPTIENQRGVSTEVKWINNLPATHLLESAIDHSLHMAHPMMGVPTAVHLHGGETEPQSDGHPDSWFTQGFAEVGSGWQKEVLMYHNEQPPSTLWYHDHALGLTRLNVYTGLAGFYLLRDPMVENALNLPQGNYEREVVIQDRMFSVDGSLLYPNVGLNPEHPQWQPEFFGDFILVNGKIWPYLDVEPRKYRLRFLNGSNSRFYNMWLVNPVTNMPGPAFYQIGTDGGYLPAPVMLNNPVDPNAPRLLMAPGERADIVIDFSGYAPGTQFVLRNNAKSPFPRGMNVDPLTTGQIMLFRVVPPTAPDNSSLPMTLNTIPTLTPTAPKRTLTLVELMGAGGPLAMFLDGKPWDGAVSENPLVGSTEIWEIVNMTADAHPIHLHLVQFQPMERQKFRATQYMSAYMMLNPVIPANVTYNPPLAPYLQGKPVLANPNERGWKDTFVMYPGEVSRIMVRFAPVGPAAVMPYPFDATAEPGYVWHCHIIEHEDNEMMRPYKLANPPLVMAKAVVPDEYALFQNAPNPFNPETTIRFSLGTAGRAEMIVFNVVGQRVRTLIDGDLDAGTHNVRWDGTDDNGRSVASGLYFYRLTSDNFTETKKMALLK